MIQLSLFNNQRIPLGLVSLNGGVEMGDACPLWAFSSLLPSQDVTNSFIFDLVGSQL